MINIPYIFINALVLIHSNVSYCTVYVYDIYTIYISAATVVVLLVLQQNHYDC